VAQLRSMLFDAAAAHAAKDLEGVVSAAEH
jgi:hypothetical protein